MNKVSLELCFVSDSECVPTFLKKAKHCDRMLCINYSVHVDVPSIEKMFVKFVGYQALVCPCVNPGIDWDMFKRKVSEGSSEPLNQMGLNFDTTVGNALSEHMHLVTQTDPKAWALDTKPIIKALKGNKGEGITPFANFSDMFKLLLDRGVKVCAFTDANLVITYPHECIGNLLSAAGVDTVPLN